MNNELGIDMRDIILEAQAEVAEVMRELAEELVLPQMIEALQMRWMTMPDELKEQLRKEQPETYRRIMDLIGTTPTSTY